MKSMYLRAIIAIFAIMATMITVLEIYRPGGEWNSNTTTTLFGTMMLVVTQLLTAARTDKQIEAAKTTVVNEVKSTSSTST